MVARGAKTTAAELVDALIRIARDLGTEYFPDCDWGGRHDGPTATVGFRKNGSRWLAVCEHHATGPNIRRPR